MARADWYLRSKLTIYLLFPLLLYLVPTEGIYHGHSICLSVLLFDRECPGCGMTRAVFSLMYGDINMAFHFNKLVICAFPALVAMWLVDVRKMIHRLRMVRLFESYSRLQDEGYSMKNFISR